MALEERAKGIAIILIEEVIRKEDGVGPKFVEDKIIGIDPMGKIFNETGPEVARAITHVGNVAAPQLKGGGTTIFDRSRNFLKGMVGREVVEPGEVAITGYITGRR